MNSELSLLIAESRGVKARADANNKELKKLKEKLRVFMIDSGIKKYEGVEIRRTFSFDVGALRLDYPELAKLYVKEETKTVTSTYDVFTKKDKERLREDHPDVYSECNIENTAQVRGL